MPENNITAKLLDMEGFSIQNVKTFPDRILLEIEMERRAYECPVCQTVTSQIHDYRMQKVSDSPIQGKHVIWLYRKRRYRCPCCKKRFYEKNYLLPKWHRITNRLALLAINMLSERRSRKDISVSCGVSESTVERWLKLTGVPETTSLPRVVSIDEFKGNTNGEKFQGIVTDPVHRKVINILPSCKEAVFSQYFSEFSNRNQVQYFVCDMKREYVSMAKLRFPQATIVIDKFHVMRYCTWALENVRKRIQKKLLPEQRKYFKRSRLLLLKHMSDLKDESKLAVERMLLFDRDLREAYLLKETFYRFMASENKTEAVQRLREFRAYAMIADIPEFESCLTMLQNWSPYILNAFDCPYTNGFTEGCNNAIKVLKRIAFGYRNFYNFRARILLTLNARKPSASPRMAS